MTVKRIVDQTAQQVTVEVDVDAKAIVGKRDVSVRRASRRMRSRSTTRSTTSR